MESRSSRPDASRECFPRSLDAGNETKSARKHSSKSRGQRSSAVGIRQKGHGRTSHIYDDNGSVSELSNQLERYRRHLDQKSSAHLEASANAHLGNLEQVAQNFDERLAVLQKAERPLLQSLESEVLQVQFISTNKNQDDSKQISLKEVKLAERIASFEHNLSAETAALSRLIDDWSMVQAELLVFAIETLGLNAMKLDEHQCQRVANELKQAGEGHTKQDLQREQAQSRLMALEYRLEDLTAQTRDKVEKQEKARNMIIYSHVNTNNVAVVPNCQKEIHETTPANNEPVTRKLVIYNVDTDIV